MKEAIEKFIIENFMQGRKGLDDDESLFESGIIDSMGFIILLAFIERKFDISIDMKEITIDNFNTIEKIVKIIEEKINKKQF
jgi:D-alanine--poly(phosphoribitol) ligase subunit 2